MLWKVIILSSSFGSGDSKLVLRDDVFFWIDVLGFTEDYEFLACALRVVFSLLAIIVENFYSSKISSIEILNSSIFLGLSFGCLSLAVFLVSILLFLN